MSTQDALEIWERQVREDALAQGLERGLAQGLTTARQGLLVLYETRFGAVPPAVRVRVEAIVELDAIGRLYDVVAHSTREEVERALGAE